MYAYKYQTRIAQFLTDPRNRYYKNFIISAHGTTISNSIIKLPENVRIVTPCSKAIMQVKTNKLFFETANNVLNSNEVNKYYEMLSPDPNDPKNRDKDIPKPNRKVCIADGLFMDINNIYDHMFTPFYEDITGVLQLPVSISDMHNNRLTMHNCDDAEYTNCQQYFNINSPYLAISKNGVLLSELVNVLSTTYAKSFVTLIVMACSVADDDSNEHPFAIHSAKGIKSYKSAESLRLRPDLSVHDMQQNIVFASGQPNDYRDILYDGIQKIKQFIIAPTHNIFYNNFTVQDIFSNRFLGSQAEIGNLLWCLDQDTDKCYFTKRPPNYRNSDARDVESAVEFATKASAELQKVYSAGAEAIHATTRHEKAEADAAKYAAKLAADAASGYAEQATQYSTKIKKSNGTPTVPTTNSLDYLRSIKNFYIEMHGELKETPEAKAVVAKAAGKEAPVTIEQVRAANAAKANAKRTAAETEDRIRNAILKYQSDRNRLQRQETEEIDRLNKSKPSRTKDKFEGKISEINKTHRSGYLMFGEEKEKEDKEVQEKIDETRSIIEAETELEISIEVENLKRNTEFAMLNLDKDTEDVIKEIRNTATSAIKSLVTSDTIKQLLKNVKVSLDAINKKEMQETVADKAENIAVTAAKEANSYAALINEPVRQEGPDPVVRLVDPVALDNPDPVVRRVGPVGRRYALQGRRRRIIVPARDLSESDVPSDQDLITIESDAPSGHVEKRPRAELKPVIGDLSRNPDQKRPHRVGDLHVSGHPSAYMDYTDGVARHMRGGHRDNNTIFREKYYKYKQKYLHLKKISLAL